MHPIREMTKIGDPMLRVKLPKPAIHLLRDLAKQNKRRYQDELIKRLVASFRHNERTKILQEELLPKLQKMYQTAGGAKQ